MKKYQVKIDSLILPQVYTFDQLIEEGLLDEVDEKIKIKLECDNTWITARDYPFSDVEKDAPVCPDLTQPVVSQTAKRITRIGDDKDYAVRHNYNNISPSPQNMRQKPNFGQRTNNQMPKIPCILDTWNWGAFVLSWIWGVCNGIYWPLIIIALNFVPYVGIIFSLGICVFLGLKGNQLAWKCYIDKNVPVFERRQSFWNYIGQIVFILSVLIGLCFIFVMFLL